MLDSKPTASMRIASSRRGDAPDGLHVELAHALGFLDYPATATAEPYLNYIVNRNVGRGTLDDYLRLVIYVVKYFAKQDEGKSPTSRSIEGLVDELSQSSNTYFSDTKAGSLIRRSVVEDTVLYAIGTWTLLLSSFVHLPMAGGMRKVMMAYAFRAEDSSVCRPFAESVAGLVQGSGLMPTADRWAVSEFGDDDSTRMKAASQLMAAARQQSSHMVAPGSRSSSNSLHKLEPVSHADKYMSLRFLDDLDSLESLHFTAKRLNAYTLSTFGAVDILWTKNISRHMVLRKRGGLYLLEVFALPCALNASTLASGNVGITPEYAQEVTESYSILFNAWSSIPRHAKLGNLIGVRRFCWCWTCSAHRYRKRTLLKHNQLCENKTPGTTRTRATHASEFDPLLLELIMNEPSDWTPELFPSLWSRITILEEHLQTAKPWNVWILFRDRRDTLQFWTFL